VKRIEGQVSTRFFEKKRGKKLRSWVRGGFTTPHPGAKVFCYFFSKK
jgi:hypothetical protein